MPFDPLVRRLQLARAAELKGILERLLQLEICLQKEREDAQRQLRDKDEAINRMQSVVVQLEESNSMLATALFQQTLRAEEAERTNANVSAHTCLVLPKPRAAARSNALEGISERILNRSLNLENELSIGPLDRSDPDGATSGSLELALDGSRNAARTRGDNGIQSNAANYFKDMESPPPLPPRRGRRSGAAFEGCCPLEADEDSVDSVENGGSLQTASCCDDYVKRHSTHAAIFVNDDSVGNECPFDKRQRRTAAQRANSHDGPWLLADGCDSDDYLVHSVAKHFQVDLPLIGNSI